MNFFSNRRDAIITFKFLFFYYHNSALRFDINNYFFWFFAFWRSDRESAYPTDLCIIRYINNNISISIINETSIYILSTIIIYNTRTRHRDDLRVFVTIHTYG